MILCEGEVTMSTDRSPQEKAAQWQFVRRQTTWVWRKLRVDGTLDNASGKEFPDYAFAVNDAINHGFHPRQDYWTIVTNLGTTHFRRGDTPAFVPHKDGDPFPPPDPPRPPASNHR